MHVYRELDRGSQDVREPISNCVSTSPCTSDELARARLALVAAHGLSADITRCPALVWSAVGRVLCCASRSVSRGALAASEGDDAVPALRAQKASSAVGSKDVARSLVL